MVRLTKIYTKTGDDGTTGLVGGARVRKDDLRVEAYGSVDEASTAIGVAIAACERPTASVAEASLGTILRSLQNDMFDLGADLATPIRAHEAPGSALRITPGQVERLETIIDAHNDKLAPLNSFVLPGGSPGAAALHAARASARRAERVCVTLLAERPGETSPHAMMYLNRLSDLLFVLARVANDWGARDVLWKPGATRDQQPTNRA